MIIINIIIIIIITPDYIIYRLLDLLLHSSLKNITSIIHLTIRHVHGSITHYTPPTHSLSQSVSQSLTGMIITKNSISKIDGPDYNEHQPISFVQCR